MNNERMAKAYLEAVYFTETGDSGEPGPDAELTPLFQAQAWIDCRNFLWAIGLDGGEAAVDGFDDLDAAQLGHDLWLTRNGHGTGFWDRPEIYGETNGTLFTRLAKAMGEHDAEFVEDGTADTTPV